MQKNVSLSLFTHLSDIETMKNTSIYKAFEDELPIIRYLFSIDEFQNIENFSKNKEFNNFKSEFFNYLQKKENSDNFSFCWILDFLQYFFDHRRKLSILFPPLLSMFLTVYKSQWDEIKDYSNNSLLRLNSYINEYTKIAEINGDINSIDFREHFYDLYSRKALERYNSSVESQKYVNLVTILYNDDVDQLISFFLQYPSITINQKIPWTFVPRITYVQDVFVSILNICCMFGSVNCFKYSLMNESMIDDCTAKYSIIGGNNEIIQTLNQKALSFDYCYQISVMNHRYSITDWLYTNFDCEDIPTIDLMISYSYEAFLFSYHNDLLNGIDRISDDQVLYLSACKSMYFPIILYILSNTSNIYQYDTSQLLYTACIKESFQIIKYLIDKGIDKQQKYDNGDTLLHIAVQQKSLSMIKFLIDNGFDKEALNDKLETPIFRFCFRKTKSLDILDFLITKGCNLKHKDKFDMTILHYACEKLDLAHVKLIISAGCDKEIEDKHGNTALFNAIESNSEEIVQFLIDSGCNTKAQNKKGYTPIFVAIDMYSSKMLSFLITHGCNTEIINKYGKTPLHYAIFKNKLEFVKCLITNNCDKEAKDDNGLTPLQYACSIGMISIVKYLITIGCNMEAKDANDKTPLHFAIEKGHLYIVTYLISQNCNKESKDKNGKTPLHYAYLYYNKSIIEFLLEQNCDTKSKDNEGKTPIQNYRMD